MIATSNFVNQVHNGTVNNNSISNVEDINKTSSSINSTEQMPFNQEMNNTNKNNCQIESNTVEMHENDDESQTNEDSVDITISNVVTNFSVCCHLNLKQIATNGSNVVYRRDQSVCILCIVHLDFLFLNFQFYFKIIIMKLRKPFVTASIWSSGKITCTGSTTEESAKSASRKVARCLQKLGFRVKFRSYRVVNVLGACKLPFGIKIHEFSNQHRPLAR